MKAFSHFWSFNSKAVWLFILHVASFLLIGGHVEAKAKDGTVSAIVRDSGIRNMQHASSQKHPNSSIKHELLDCLPGQITGPHMVTIAGDVATYPLVEDLKEAEAFARMQPMVTIEVRSNELTQTPWWKLSEKPVVAVTSEIMEDHDRLTFEKEWGYQPTQLRIAADPVVTIIHHSNPLVQRGITLSELDAIFSQTLLRGHPSITRWNDLNLGEGWTNRPIIIHGYDASTGLYAYFKKHVLQEGDFKNAVHRHPRASQVAWAVGEDINAIGFATFSTVTSRIKIVPLRINSEMIKINNNNITVPSQYPLIHYLYMYMNWNCQKPSGNAVKELLRFIYSQQGQMLLLKRRYFPLPPKIIAQEWKRVSCHLSR